MKSKNPEHVFISDAHLGAFSEEKNREIELDLIALVESCKERSIHIHVLGDLFDYWMEYPNTIPDLGKDLLAHFKAYNRRNGGTTYITGNHDHWTKGYFEEIGFCVEKLFCNKKVGNKQIFMHHGDGFPKGMFGLRRTLFNTTLRQPWFTTLYQLIFPAEAGLHLMKTISAIGKARNIADAKRLDGWTESFLKKTSYDVVLSGHDHIPRMETFGCGIHINTGAFCHHRSVVVYTNNEFRLVRWDGRKKEFNEI